MGLESFTTGSQLLKPYSDESYLDLKEDRISVKVVESSQTTTRTFLVTDLDIFESSSDSSA